MAELKESKTIDWSPWKHPKAKRWFEELLEETHLPLMMEHAVDQADDSLNEGETRLMVALALLLGREGIWPGKRDVLLRTIVRKGDALVNRKASRSDVPMSLTELKFKSTQHDNLVQEVELLRRRVGMSNRTTRLDPPAWGDFWS